MPIVRKNGVKSLLEKSLRRIIVMTTKCLSAMKQEGESTENLKICFFFFKYFADRASQYIDLLISTNLMHYIL